MHHPNLCFICESLYVKENLEMVIKFWYISGVCGKLALKSVLDNGRKIVIGFLYTALNIITTIF